MTTTHTSPSATTTVQRPRSVETLINGQATSDGDGVKLTRVLTQNLQMRLDPFLMLDHFASENPGDYIGGFPSHPHRGFETVTLMVEGRMRHKDSHGNEGLLQSGGVQWMTAGRGLIHSEMPEQDQGLMEGFQLWLNLPATDKMCAPWYRDIQRDEVPQVTTEDGVSVRVIAGHSHNTPGAVTRPRTEPVYLDLTLPPGSRFAQPLSADFNALVYVYRGSLDIGGTAVNVKKMAVLRNDPPNNPSSDGVVLTVPATQSEPTRAILIAGRPLREPIAQYGPFVMNTREQLMQAVEDFNKGQLA
jgi:redox-sensitive bicupin YhaK (pirin superfamily)